MSERITPTVLDRSLPAPGLFGLAALGMVLVAFIVRFTQLDTYVLNAREANWAYDAWSMFYGRPLPIGQQLPDASPFMLIWNSVPFYLFGVSDATARMGSALLGVGMIGFVLLMRPFLTRPQIIAVAGILAVSPTMVFASRTVEPGIAAAFFALLIVVALLRAGLATHNQVGWATLLGFAIAGLYATGPSGVTALLSLTAAIIIAGLRSQPGQIAPNAVGTALRTLFGDRHAVIGMTGGLIVGLLVLFTRSFSSLSSLSGLGTTITDWVAIMNGGTSTVPVMFYFWSVMLYETIAVLLAIGALALSRTSAMASNHRRHHVPISLFATWFVVALLLHSTASTRDTGSAVLVALPLLMMAGMGLGGFVQSAASWTHLRNLAASIVTIILVAYSLNTMIGLNFTRGESGSEPLTHDTPSADAAEFIDRVMRLSRDISVTQPSPIDPTGQYGLVINVTPEYEWPFTWYFRQFHGFSVTPAAGFTADTDVAIASSAEVMDSVGLMTSTTEWIARPGDSLTMMRSGDIIRTGLNPLNWDDAWNYMIDREAPGEDEARTITVGHSVRVMNKLTAQTGPFNLFSSSSPGTGSGLGQLDTPTGIAIGADGTIYVLNAGNARIDRYAPDGTFIGVWNGQVEAPLQLSWNGWQGGTGLKVGPDGLLYIADTWNHNVVVVSPAGTVVRMLGNRGVQTDITDVGTPDQQPGLFFGPRDVAITDERIFVTDTGNERVQVFANDGTFITAFGGYGSGDGQFIEPTGIVAAPDGSIWVADSGNARLQQFTPEGEFISEYPVQEWENQFGIDRLNMLAIDDAGILYYTVPNRGVWAWKDGNSTQLPGSRSINAGGIAIAGEGELLVTDRTSASVVRLVVELPPGWVDTAATPTSSPQATPAD